MISTRTGSLEKLKQGLRWLRREPERLCHPLRRRWAKRRVAELPSPQTVLVVCYGNICRSPYAAAKLRGLLRERGNQLVRVDSAGFVGPHRESPPEAIDAASARGFDLRRHRSRVISPESAQRAGLIVVMEPGQARDVHRRFGIPVERLLVLGDLDPEPIHTRLILDPVLKPRAVFVECYDRIDRCLVGLVDLLWKPLPGGQRGPGGDSGNQQPPEH